MLYKPRKLRRWLLTMNAKQSLKGFDVVFDPNPNKVTVFWDRFLIVFDPNYFNEDKLSICEFINNL